jgi:hypothetical protein
MVGAAEERGLDSAWVPDHLLGVFGPVLDSLTALAFLAGSTSRIKLGTGVLVLPYRHPVALANAASTLDVLSGGRFVPGAGWNAGEFEALGMSVDERGRRTDEILECLQRLWPGEKSSFCGRFYSFKDAEIGTIPDGLRRLGEEPGCDPDELEIETTLDVKLPTTNEPGSSAQTVAEALGQLKEAGTSFCALSLLTPEAPARIAEEVAPHIP